MRNLSGNLQGILWMLLTGVLFVGVTGIVRHLGSEMHPIQAAFLRYAFGLAFLAPVLFQIARRRRFSPRLGLHAVRGILHGIGVMLWFYAMTRIPIAEVTALGFTGPIFTTIGAALFLGERIRLRRIGAVVVAFGGTLIILRPGLQIIDPGALAQVLAAPLFAASLLMAKRLTASESNAAIVAYMGVFVTATLLPPALLVWRPPTAEEYVLLLITAVLATLGHVCMTQAFRSAEITVTQPATFLQLVWATILGMYVFGEQPDLWTWVGGGVIVASATYIAHRESLSRRAEAPPAAG